MPGVKTRIRRLAVLVWPALTLALAWPGVGRAFDCPVQLVQAAPSHAGTAAAPDSLTDARLDGEYGLSVGVNDTSLEVRWITSDIEAGLLQVFVGGKLYRELETPPARAHAVSFPKPRSKQLVLRYGSLTEQGDRHETAIDVNSGRRRERPVYSGVDSIFVVGDIHGQYDRLIGLLSNAGLIDRSQRWSGGHKHLVLLGDLVDRGPDATRLLWFLYRLEAEARAHGGRLHVMLGNHEIMVMRKELTYTSPKELLLAEYYGLEYNQMFDPRNTLLGKWLAAKPALLKINDILFAHGGVSTALMNYSVESFDDSLAAFIGEPLFSYWADTTVAVPPLDSAALARRIDLFFAETSVFWYRDYVVSDTLQDALAAVLARFRARLHVVGHTHVPHIVQRYDGALLAVNVEEDASEMLLLVRSRKGYERYVYRLEGPAEALAPPDSVAPPPQGQRYRSP